ncbi:hypothetical protein ABIF33_005093 [Bradyrhizobium elkanii]
MGLEHDLDVGMLAQLDARDGVRDPVLACLDLAQLQARYRREINPGFERRSFQRIDVELAAKVSERIRPALDLPLGRQSVRAERMDCIGHLSSHRFDPQRDCSPSLSLARDDAPSP